MGLCSYEHACFRIASGPVVSNAVGRADPSLGNQAVPRTVLVATMIVGTLTVAVLTVKVGVGKDVEVLMRAEFC